jgi:hypothetical protein
MGCFEYFKDVAIQMSAKLTTKEISYYENAGLELPNQDVFINDN